MTSANFDTIENREEIYTCDNQKKRKYTRVTIRTEKYVNDTQIFEKLEHWYLSAYVVFYYLQILRK